MALKYKKPNVELESELMSVAQDAQSVITSLEQQNYIPADFPTATLIDICETLIGLPHGTAEGCRVPLEYARGRLPAIRRNHFVLESNECQASIPVQEPQLTRGMSLDRTLTALIASITTALDEYRFQASEQHEEPSDRLAEVPASSVADVAKVVSGADRIESAMHDAVAELAEMANPRSENVDTLSRTLRDTEGLAKVSKAELNFGTVVLRWYKSISQTAKKMPKLIVAAAKMVKVGTDISKSFSERWMEMCEGIIDFGLGEVDKWADTAIEVGTKLQSRIDGTDTSEANRRTFESGSGEFDAGSLYREGYISYIEKRGLYGFLVDSEDNRYYLPLQNGHLRTGQAAELGSVARFRFSVNQRGNIAIEVTFVENSVFSTEHGVIRLSNSNFDFNREISETANELARRGRVSLHKLRTHMANLFKSPLPLEEMLGYRTFRELVVMCPGLDISGEEPNLWVEIDSPTAEAEEALLSREAFESWLLEALSDGAHPDGILLSKLGVMARAHFGSSGRIPAALGFQTYVQILESIKSVRVVGSKGGAESVVLSTVADEKGLMRFDARVSDEERHQLTFEAFSDWIHEMIARPENSNGILLSRVGLEAQNYFSVTGKIPPILGFKNYSSLILSMEGLALMDTPPRQRVVRS